MNQKLLPEWHEQDAILLTWPHPNSPWKENLEQVEATYLQLTQHISQEQAVIIQLDSSCDVLRIVKQLNSADAKLDNCYVAYLDSDDTWTRDHGPISILSDGAPALLDFNFNGWGQKFDFTKDNALNKQMHEQKLLPDIKYVNWVLEGGSIETDGEGILLTTEECLLNPNRQIAEKTQVEALLKNEFGISKVLWLTQGFISGDDTDSHIDTLARLAPANRIIFQGCQDNNDLHYHPLNQMKQELESFTNHRDKPYQLIELPLPKPIYADDGHRLPATYANFLITNKLVLLPTYQDDSDEVALELVQAAFADRKVIGIPALPLIDEHGSIHCITMQLSKETVDFNCRKLKCLRNL